MSRLVSKLSLAMAVLLFITFFCFRHSLPNGQHTIPIQNSNRDGYDGSAYVNDDFLRGANLQKPALASPPTYVVSEEILSGPNRKLSPEEQKQKDDSYKKSQAEKKNKEDQQRRLKNEEQEAKVKAAYQKIKIYTGAFDVPRDLMHDPMGPKPHEIVLLAASDGNGHNGGIKNILADVTPNRQEYADLHGYHYVFINITKYDIGSARPVWAKLPAIVEAFNLYPSAKWVWWLDLDAIIMTPTVELTAHILSQNVLLDKMKKGAEMNKPGGGRSGIFTLENPDISKIDIIFAQDQNGLNAGSFFIRRSEFSRMLIDLWSEPLFVRENWDGQEQDALWHLVKEHPTVLEHLALVSQTQINAYPVENVADMSWETGNLVVHIAGCWVKNQCNDQWEKFMDRRIVVSASMKDDFVTGATAKAT